MTLYDHQVRERKEYPGYNGPIVITVGEKEGRFVVFEMREYNHDKSKVDRFGEVQIRYVGDTRPEAALQVDVSVTEWNYNGRPHTTLNGFSLPADMVEKWIVPMMPKTVEEQLAQVRACVDALPSGAGFELLARAISEIGAIVNVEQAHNE